MQQSMSKSSMPSAPPGMTPIMNQIQSILQRQDRIILLQQQSSQSQSTNESITILTQWQRQQEEEIKSIDKQLQQLSSSIRAQYADLVYLPLFTLLMTHPKAMEKQQKMAPTGPTSPPTPISNTLLPYQTNVWEAGLTCLVTLLTSGVDPTSIPFIRAMMTKRFFGIFQLLLNYITTAEEKKSTQTKESTASLSPAPSPLVLSEEIRLLAMTCLQLLLRCVEAQFSIIESSSSSSSSSLNELQPLIQTFQLNPGFSIALGYYIHQLLRCVNHERNRAIRTNAIESLDTIMRTLQMNALNQPSSASIVTAASSTSPASFTQVPGRILLLSYFPGVTSALYHLLVYDAESSHSGGWKLRLTAFKLFHSLICTVVYDVAGRKEIVADLIGGGTSSTSTAAGASMDDEESITTEESQHAAAMERAMKKLYALVPRSATSSSSATILTTQPTPDISLASVHPILQTILKPINSAWWQETRQNISNMMQRIFQSITLIQHPAMALVMLQATERYIIGTSTQDISNLSNRGTIFTSLLPSVCVVTWLEFIIECHEHEDLTLRTEAARIIGRIRDQMKVDPFTTTHLHMPLIEASTSLTPIGGGPPSSSSLVALLSSALTRHLLRLPRRIVTASESQQLAILKTIRGYFHLLGEQQALYAYVSTDIDRLLKIFYHVWSIESHESKVLEREKENNNTAVAAISNEDTTLTTTSTSLPTYYAFSFSHLHSLTVHEFSLSILHMIGFYLAEHFGLFIAHLHERLLGGIKEVQQGNFSTNQLKETVLFINQVILGVGDAIRTNQQLSVFDIIPHIELLMFEYLNPTLWHLPLINDSRSTRTFTQAELQNNLLIVSLLIRGIGDMATSMGIEFRPELMHLLYPLLEKLSSPHSSIHQAALVTLHRLAQACQYNDGAPNSSADDTLQQMIVENMDYLVEQMAVELRNLNMNEFTRPDTAHPLTLPLVLSALLTKVSLSCTQAIIPLLDDILKVILDKLCELSLMVDDGSTGMTDVTTSSITTTHVSRLAYLEILRSVVTAIHQIQRTEIGSPEPVMPSVFASAPPIPLAASEPKLLTSSESEPSHAALALADSMLNLADYDDGEEVKSPPEKKARQQSPDHTMQETKPTSDSNYFAPDSIRQRLQSMLDLRAKELSREAYETNWLNRTRAGVVIEEEDETKMADDDSDDVPRDASGKTSAERWYEERERERAKEAEKKFNSMNGIEDAETEAEMEREEKAHKEEPEIPLTKEQQTTLNIFQQCRNFLTPGIGPVSLAQQYTTLCIAAEAIPILEHVPKQFFPEIAKFWPSLLQALRLMDNSTISTSSSSTMSLKQELRSGGFESSVVSSEPSRLDALRNVPISEEGETPSDRQLSQLIQSLTATTPTASAVTATGFTHSTASPLFIQSLSILALLTRTASKFLSGRFSNELWPVLQHILSFEKGWMKETMAMQRTIKKQHSTSPSKSTRSSAQSDSNSGLELLPAYKIQRALLQTLGHIARFPDLATQHILSLASHVAPYLHQDQPTEFQQLAVRMMSTLVQLDADVVWFVLWKLAPEMVTSDSTRLIGSKFVINTSGCTFLAHPCFQQVYTNFDAQLLLHQRVSIIQEATQPSSSTNAYGTNVQSILTTLRQQQSQTKLTMF